MSIVLWAVLALGAGFAALWLVGRLARPTSPPLPDEARQAVTPLQRVARWSVGSGAVLSALAATLVLVKGAQATFESDALRTTLMLLLLAILGVAGASTIWLKGQVSREGGALDERDRAILGRAATAQAAGMMITLAIWVIGLTEHYHEAGAVPLFYLNLVFWSCVVVHLLGLPVGILLGYRRS
jgi:hypothetical protein